MKKLVFLVSVFDKSALRIGDFISQPDFDMMHTIAEKLRVQALIRVAIPEVGFASRTKDVKMADIRTYRDTVLADIKDQHPDVVVACGPIALKCLTNKGNSTLDAFSRVDFDIPELEGVTCIASHSLEHIYAKPGLAKHLMLDINAGLHGRTATKWGKYVILQPDTPEWDVRPPALCVDKGVGLDLETYPRFSPWHPQARIRMCVISDKVGRAWVVQARRDSALPRWLTDIISDPLVVKAGSNIKFDYQWLLRYGTEMQNMWDTSTAEHTIDCTNPLKDLKSLTFMYVPKLGDYSRGHRQLVKERGGWEFIEDHEMYQYCGGDGEASIGTMLGQIPPLKAAGLMRPFRLSRALYPVLAGMESRGACVDRAVNRELNDAFGQEMGVVQDVLRGHFGPVNLNSTQQVAEALIRVVPNIDLTKAKLIRQLAGTPYKLHKKEAPDQYSTDKAVLEREAEKHTCVADLQLYRRLSALHTTFVHKLHDEHYVPHPDGRDYVHTTYRTDVVETARLSSQGPNQQNNPRKPDIDDKHPIPLYLNPKRQFISRFDGGVILEGDLSQAEVRVAADISGDRALIEALCSGEDIHYAVASQVFGKPISEVTRVERTLAKRVTFLTMYGGGANTLALQLGIPVPTAKDILARYFSVYHELDRYIEQCNLQVKRDLYSDSIFGYRRYFRKPAQWKSREGYHVERQAWNHKVQNGAACITYAAMIELDNLLDIHRYQSRIIMQVHDSIVVDCHPSEVQKVAEFTKVCMEQPDLERWGVHLSVPLVADIEAGPNWGEKIVVDMA